MYPDEIAFGFGLYEILIVIGIIACFLVFRFYLTDKDMSPKVYNFYLLVSISSIILGFFFAAVFQSLFTYFQTGHFSLFESGITFYGGLFGGIIAFLILLLGVGGLLFKEKEHLKAFRAVLSVAPCCVTVAHAFGRLGCLFAGCCHGAISDSGLYMYVDEIGAYAKCVPLQLFEAIFLFIIFGVLTFLYFKKIHYEAEVYCISYGVWRFIIEFFRTDDRGQLIKGVLTPSQGFAILFVLAGVALFVYRFLTINKHKTPR